MLCHRCGSHIADKVESCPVCGQDLRKGGVAAPGASSRRGGRESLAGAPYQAGDWIEQAFEVLGVLGQGPVGHVFRAKDVQLGIEVRLKVIAGHLVQTDAERARVVSALLAAKRVSHGGVQAPLSAGIASGRPYYTGMVTDGQTLATILEGRRRADRALSLTELEPILEQVVEALEAIHKVGPHANLKPQNIVLMPGRVVLTDLALGVALPALPYVQAQRAAQVDAYLPPEMVRGHPIGPTSDVYSLAVIAWEMVTGRLPTAAPLPSPKETRPDLPESLGSIFRRGTHESAAARFPTPNAFWTELKAVLVKTPPPLPGAGGRADRRRTISFPPIRQVRPRLPSGPGRPAQGKAPVWPLAVVLASFAILGGTFALGKGPLTRLAILGRADAGTGLGLALPVCPMGMAPIPAGPFRFGTSAADPLVGFDERAEQTVEVAPYCIDLYEFPNQAGRLPLFGASWTEAKEACARQNKRLCSEAEWEKACKGPSSWRYPYGDRFDPLACNTQNDRGEDRQLAPSGQFPRCRSPYGPWDLSGNLAEWTDSPFGIGTEPSLAETIKGGAYNRPDYASRCSARRKAMTGFQSPQVGFRCCAASR